MVRRRALLILPLLGTIAACAQDGSLHFSSGPEQVTLIELYSSEGCSSCPPAEQWLNALSNEAGLWTSFIPMAFHVDYWNRLGWTDAFSQKKFTRRQYAYSKIWGSSSVYTPGFAVNGYEQRFVGRDKRWTKSNGLDTGKLHVSLTDRVALVQYAPGKSFGPMNVNVALLGMNLHSEVKAGENRGRHLEHSFVALHWDEKPATNRNGQFMASFVLPPVENAAAKSFALVAWVSERATMKPVQAAGAPILYRSDPSFRQKTLANPTFL